MARTDASFSTRGWLHPAGSKLDRRRRPWLHGAVVLASWCLCGVDAYTLRVRVQPGRAQGGVAFLEQPQVEILEGNGGDMDVFFEVGTAVNGCGIPGTRSRCSYVCRGRYSTAVVRGYTECGRWVSLMFKHVCY